MKKSIFILLIISFAACEKNIEEEVYTREITKDDFKEIAASSQKYFFEEIINPSEIGLAGDNVLISEAWRVPEEFPRIHLINSTDWSYDKPKGKHGQGPLEITDAAGYLFSSSTDSFIVYNMNQRKLVEFSIKDTSLLAVHEQKLSAPMAMIHFVEIGSDSTYLAKPWDGLEILTEYDREGNLKGKFGQWEPIPDRTDLNSKQVSEVNSGWLDGNPEVGVFVRTGLHRDVMSVFHYREKKFYTIYGPNMDLPLFEVHETEGPSIFFNDDSVYGYRDVVVTEDYIYALYAGNSQKEYNQTGIMAKEIFVFDLKGKPFWKINLDKSIINFVINEQTNEIYGLTTDEDPGIAVFKIPQELL